MSYAIYYLIKRNETKVTTSDQKKKKEEEKNQEFKNFEKQKTQTPTLCAFTEENRQKCFKLYTNHFILCMSVRWLFKNILII